MASRFISIYSEGDVFRIKVPATYSCSECEGVVQILNSINTTININLMGYDIKCIKGDIFYTGLGVSYFFKEVQHTYIGNVYKNPIIKVLYGE